MAARIIKPYNKHTQFELLASRVRATVTAYWQAHGMPLGRRYAMNACLPLLRPEHREEFKQFVVANQYVHEIVAFKTASKYLFPPLLANSISEDMQLDAMAKLEQVLRQAHNRTRNERLPATIANNYTPVDAIPIRRPRKIAIGTEEAS